MKLHWKLLIVLFHFTSALDLREMASLARQTPGIQRDVFASARV